MIPLKGHNYDRNVAAQSLKSIENRENLSSNTFIGQQRHLFIVVSCKVQIGGKEMSSFYQR